MNKILRFTVTPLMFLLFLAGTVYGQNLNVQGKITDSRTGDVLAGVNIVVQGTVTGTISEINGNYSINVPSANSTLVFTYIGYAALSVPVDGRTTLNVSLTQEAKALDEIVVIGYGTQRKSDLTGSISVANVGEISKVATNDITKALQGKVSGISVQSGGEPGAVPNIKIRGVGTWNNNSPLYIVDGAVAPINDLPMTDIESIQVLKDASAAAIYGSRAANGVVIITTKRGAPGAMKIDYSGYYGVQNIVNRYDVCNREEYQLLANEISVNAGLARYPANDPSSPYYVNDINTDWQKELFKTGSIMEHNLNLSGGDQNSTYNFSVNYFDNVGTLKGNGPEYTRYSVGFNSDHKRNKFKFGESLHYTKVDQAFMVGLKDEDIVKYAVYNNPSIPVYDPTTIDGYGADNKNINGSYSMNVIGMNKMIESNTDRYRFISNLYGQYEIITGLTYKMSLSFERIDWRDFFFEPIHNLGWQTPNSDADMNDNHGYGQTATMEHTLTFDRTFGKHKITAMIGNTVLNSDILRTYGEAHGFSQPYFKVLSQGTTKLSAGDEYHNRLLSYFGRAIYSWDDRFLLTATIRRDGSSRFSPNNRWGNFPSVAVAWKLHNESFFKSLPIISTAKLRASYGELGNQEIPNYSYQAVINPYANYVLNNQLASGASQFVFVSPDIKWETKKATNIGIDLGFLKDRITFTAEYFNNKTEDILIAVPIPGTFGSYDWQSPTINAGSMVNRGFEFNAAYNKAEGEFTYSIGANLSTLHNEVLSLGYGNTPVYGTISRTAVGGSYGDFYGFVIDNIFQTQAEINTLNAASPNGIYQDLGTHPGDYKFKDINGRDANGKLAGEPDGFINDDDRTYLGRAIPNLYYGFNFNAAYKNFDLGITANGSSGNLIFNSFTARLEGGSGWDNYSKNLLNRWTPTNINTDVPRVVAADPNKNSRNSSRWLEKGDYLKITNIELGYTFPRNIVSKIKASNLRIYVSAQNVFTFTKYTGFDPDFGNDGLLNRGVDHGTQALRAFTGYFGGLPNPRTLIIGVKLGL
ncbi:MAG: TonB-dependent receptor [Bacteroidota bacterium]